MVRTLIFAAALLIAACGDGASAPDFGVPHCPGVDVNDNPTPCTTAGAQCYESSPAEPAFYYGCICACYHVWVCEGYPICRDMSTRD